MDELHGQILSLREVRTGATLLNALEKKMKDISDKVSNATIAMVDLQEKLMISRVHFQDAVAELSLEPTPGAAAPGRSECASHRCDNGTLVWIAERPDVVRIRLR